VISQTSILTTLDSSLLAEQDITVKRCSEELKLNLAKGGLVSFLTADTGIQDIERLLMSDSSSNRKTFSSQVVMDFSLALETVTR
jgi:hypothetical protein